MDRTFFFALWAGKKKEHSCVGERTPRLWCLSRDARVASSAQKMGEGKGFGVYRRVAPETDACLSQKGQERERERKKGQQSEPELNEGSSVNPAQQISSTLGSEASTTSSTAILLASLFIA